MSNVLSEEKKQQVIALGRLGWSLRRIQQATHIRRETAARYLKAAGIAVRPPRGWGRQVPAKPANEVTTDPESKVALPLHCALMRSLGIALTEICGLEKLAASCAEDGQYTFLYTAAPLKVNRASGSPVNPVVIK